MEIRKAIYGLLQVGILANKLLKKRLKPKGYFEVAHTPGLWKHITRPVQFTLVADDFGVKVVGDANKRHLTTALKKYYKLKIDHTESLYCGINLDWNYKDRHVDINMQGCMKKLFQKYRLEPQKKPQHSPYPAALRKYGKDAQVPITKDSSETLNQKEKKRVEQIVGSILYYARAIDLTALIGLSSTVSQQAKATENL